MVINMKNKILGSLLCGALLVSLTGCGDKKVEGNATDNSNNTNNSNVPSNDGTVLFRCGDGNVNNSVWYDEYKMKDNKILEFNSYEEIVFKTKEEMEKKYDFYKEMGVYKVEKINDTTLKVIDEDPLNVYEVNGDIPTYEEIIKDYEKDGDFCQISKDGSTFEKLENNLSNKDSERAGWDNSIYYMDEYDSGVIYAKNADISYKMIDGFNTEEKIFGKKETTESFKKLNNDVYLIKVTASETSYHALAKDDHKTGADTATYSKRKFDLDYDERNKATEIKTTKIGDYDVYYYYGTSNIVSESTSLNMFFDISEEYFIQIEVEYSSKINFEDVKNQDLKDYEDLIKSFEIKNI